MKTILGIITILMIPPAVLVLAFKIAFAAVEDYFERLFK